MNLPLSLAGAGEEGGCTDWKANMGNFNIYFQTLTLSPKRVLPACAKETLRISAVTPAIALTAFSSCSGAHLPVFSHLLTNTWKLLPKCLRPLLFLLPLLQSPPHLKTELNKHAINLYACSIAPCWTVIGPADAYIGPWLLIKPF